MSETLRERLRTYVSAFDALRDENTNAAEIAHRDMIAAALERVEASDFERRILRRVLEAHDDEALVDTAHRIARERERLGALEADAARWRWIRQALEVDGDFTDGGHGSHAQWLYVDEEKLLPATREGWSHTVESLVDAAIASAAPAPAGQGCPHLHQSELGSTGGLRWQCLDCGMWSTEQGLRVGEVPAPESQEVEGE